MGTNATITLGGLLGTIVSAKPITVNLFNQDELLLITFLLPGYPALEDVLEEDQVTKIEIVNMTTLNITINTEGN